LLPGFVAKTRTEVPGNSHGVSIASNVLTGGV